jgi:hypothetical protein
MSQQGPAMANIADLISSLFRKATGVLGVTHPVFLSNQGAPPATQTGGGTLYVEGGALKYKGSSGTVTTLGNP